MLVWLSAMWALHWGCVVGVVGLAGSVLLMGNQQRIHSKERRRDRRIREEFETYARLDARLRKGEDIRELAKRVCRLVARKSAFQRVAILAQDTGGRIYVAGSIGMDEMTTDALQSWGERVAKAEPGEIGGRSEQTIGEMRLGEKSFAVVLGKESAAMGCGRAIIVPLRTIGDHMSGALVVCADRLMTLQRRTVEETISPLETLAVKLERSIEDAAQAKQVRQAEEPAGLELLVGGVARALSDPLTAVLGFAELIAETANEPRARSDAERIIEEGRRMRQTVQNLLNFGHPGTPLDEPVEVGSLVREVGTGCEEKLESRGIRLLVQIEDDLPPIHGNGDRLRQALEHLLDNAAQSIAVSASEDSGREHEIRIAVSRDGGSVQVIVSDTGPGFKEPGRVFDSLHIAPQQGDSPEIGLSICHEIVREHGGEIGAFNLHPYGAAVVMELPLGETLEQNFSGAAREVA